MKIFFKYFFTLFFLVFSTYLFSIEKISDIKIEGLQRVDPGLVFNNLPFEINDDFDSIDYPQVINLLYKTGQFKDITVERINNDLIISLKEKPLLFKLDFHGTEIFQPEALTQALNAMNIASGLVIDEADLARAQSEIASQYLSYGKYKANVSYKITPLSNNRVNVDFFIDEGSISRIREINILGNFTFKNIDLLDEFSLKKTNYLSWWNKDDRYSRQTLSGDLEKLKSFYMDRGYLDFKINSSIVSISKNKKNVYINISIDEGNKYYFNKISLSGNIPEKIDTNELTSKIKISKGTIFSRKLVNNITKELTGILGNYGYAFANVNALPNVDPNNKTVDFNFNIDPGKKIYVRRINVIGNDSTKDEVIRRELRQYESSWFSQEKIDLSRQRLTRTQFFENVIIETPTVPGTSDQVDLNLTVKETNTGKFSIGAGVSSSEGIVGTFGLSQANFLGTGNRVSTNLSLGGVNKVYSLDFLDPYWTNDGVSRGITAYYRDYDTKDLNTGDYETTELGFGMNFGIPLDEFRKFTAGVEIDLTELNLQSTSPQKYKDYCSGSTSCDADSITLNLNWNDNTVDDAFFATKGHKLTLAGDIALPGLDLEYYKVVFKGEKYFSLSDNVVTKVKGLIGYADSYGDEPFPFFKNFRVGGKSTVRGYKEGSIGKKTFDSNDGGYVTYGGEKSLSFGAETFFPIPFLKKSEQYRLGAFVEGGAAFEDSYGGSEIRYGAGISFLWISPFGPLNASIAIPLNEGDNEQTEKFQFGMGSSF